MEETTMKKNYFAVLPDAVRTWRVLPGPASPNRKGPQPPPAQTGPRQYRAATSGTAVAPHSHQGDQSES